MFVANVTASYRCSSARPAALCFRGGPMPRSLNWRDCKIEYGVDLQAPKQPAVITGCGSYLIQPRFFDESLWDYSIAPAGAFYMDDMWISGCLERRGAGSRAGGQRSPGHRFGR